MRRFVFLLVAIIFLTFSSGAKAEVRYFVKTAKAFIGDNQTKNDARMLATLEAKRMALEEAGTYVESLTIVKNAMVAKDEILAFTAGVAKTEILEERLLIEGESYGIEVKAKVTVDTSILAERIERLRQDNKLLEDNKQLINRNNDLEEELKQLRAKLDKAKDRSEVKELQKKTEVIQERYTATEWFEKGYNAGENKNWDEAIVCYSKAIELDPDYAMAYNNRGWAYNEKGEYERAKEDYRKACELGLTSACSY